MPRTGSPPVEGPRPRALAVLRERARRSRHANRSDGTPPLGGGEAPNDRGRRHASRPAPAAHRRGERSRHVERDERDDDALLGDDERAVGGPMMAMETATVVPAAARMVPPGPDPHRGRGRLRKFNRLAESPRPACGRRDAAIVALAFCAGPDPPATRPASRTPAHGPAVGPGRGRMQRGTPRRPRGDAEELVGQVAKETGGDGWADVWKRHHIAAGGDAPLTAERRLWLPRHLPRHVLRQPAQAPQVASRSCSAEASGCQGDEDRTPKARPGRPAVG